MQGSRLEPVAEHGHQVVAGAKPERVESGHRPEDPLEPVGVGQAALPFDDGAGGGASRRRAEERPAEIRHRRVPPRGCGSVEIQASVRPVAASSTAATIGA